MSPATPCNMDSRGKNWRPWKVPMGSAIPDFSAFLNNRVNVLLISSAEQRLEGLWIKIMKQAKDGRRCLGYASLVSQCQSCQINP